MIIYPQMIETEEDKVKFENLYTKYRDQMYYVAYQILRNNISAAMNSDASIFSKVFEANITASLSAYKTKESSVEKLYKLLSMLARHIHFNKK